MATHYVYDDPDKTQLAQGDVLKPTAALVQLLKQYHPHYAEHPDYEFFAILTQSCDLVRRSGKPPKTPYIAIAAARTLEKTLIREAAKTQKEWQRPVKVIGCRERNNLLLFLKRVLDNNEPGHFYLHVDQELGIHRPCCVVLALSVTLRAEHYEMLLDAKLAQLKDTFQAKLGWLIGNMYCRVGTTEWDAEYPDSPLQNVATKMLEDTLHYVNDEQIKEGLAELRESGEIDSMTPERIFEHIRKKNIVKRSKRFELRAAEISKSLKLVNPIRQNAISAIEADDALKKSVLQILVSEDVSEEKRDALASKLVSTLSRTFSQTMTDRDLPGRDDIVLKFIRGILQDSKIAALLR